ncbi:MAG TPA: bifunctional DNA primase/polymerase [Mycobacterium sp.]|nr:bifunctional DNA primase/polymerase [Mycobacterium sp.]
MTPDRSGEAPPLTNDEAPPDNSSQTPRADKQADTDIVAQTRRIPEPPADVDNLTAALAYADAGWYLVPVRRSTKNPGSVVGDDWQHQSSRDHDQIAAWFAGTDHGIALHAARSGAVVIDMDHRELCPGWLMDALKDSWAPFQSSRTNADGRGHHIFLQPPGRTLGNGLGEFSDCGFEVRGNNGVIIIFPSVHENANAGGRYAWELTGKVPILPNVIADKLPDATEATESATDAEVAAFLETHTAADRPELLRTWCEILAQHFETGSRHNGLVSVLTGAMKEARAGYFSGASACSGNGDHLAAPPAVTGFAL